jgi:cold shock CspA family protein/ribosome-associated translation inhibitor RaiA
MRLPTIMLEDSAAPPTIAWRHVDASPIVETLATKRYERLRRFGEGIESCDIVVEGMPKRKRTARGFRVRVTLHLPGPDLTAQREVAQGSAQEDIELALNRAFSALEKQLKTKWKTAPGHGGKFHDPVLHGVVTLLEKELGWGTVRADDGREVYFQKDSLAHADWDKLSKGTRLRFREAMGDKGPYATGVSLA